MKTYTVHGTRADYEKSFSIPCLDSEGNIFPTMSACARYHGTPLSTMHRNEYVRPVKSKTLDKMICTSTEYIRNLDLLFPANQEKLNKILASTDMLFNDYIFKGIPAVNNEDGTVTRGMRIHDGSYVFSDFEYWRWVNDWVKRGSPMSELFGGPRHDPPQYHR